MFRMHCLNIMEIKSLAIVIVLLFTVADDVWAQEHGQHGEGAAFSLTLGAEWIF